MKKLVLFAILMTMVTLGCSFQVAETPTVQYEVDFANAEHNEARITMTLENLLPDPVTVAMSRTSPGRYAQHEFAKNVYDVHVVNGAGDTLSFERPDLHRWTIEDHDGSLQFSYTLYGDHADGTYTGINEQHAHMNIPATFVWVPDFAESPVSVTFHPPEGSQWNAATQLKPTDEEMTFTAPNFDYFLDSPVELSDFTLTEWQAPSDSMQQTIQLAVHHNGTDEQVEEYASMAKKVVAEQVAIFGNPPEFNFGEYNFIADYLPYVYRDGMEHRNSTILTSQRPLKEEGILQNLYTLSHEFFHSWNVERLRPEDLEPFDFMNANVSEALWFAEGFTSYYDDLTIRRAGIIDDQKYAEDWSGTLDFVLNSPGNTFNNPKEMSMQAPFVDAATSVDAQNRSNTFISYYSWGAVLGLSLDLMLRTEFEAISLDDYMRLLWEKYGESESSYSIDELQSTLAELTGSSSFADHFFREFISQGNHADLESLLAEAGFALQKANPGAATLQFGSQKIDFEDGEAIITDNTYIGSPLYEAGLDRGDIIQSVAGREISNAKELHEVLMAHEPEDSISINFVSLGEVKERTVELAEDPELEVVPFEQTDEEITNSMKQFRKEWLGSKAQ